MPSKITRSHDATLREVLGTNTRATVARIVRTWETADAEHIDAGRTWYPTAYAVAERIALDARVDVETAVAVIAALSPKTSWSVNVRGARELLVNGTRGVGIMGDNYARALDALASPNPLSTLPRGKKTEYFARNILGCAVSVTVDSHAWKIALGDSAAPVSQLSRVGVYDAVARCYTLAAERLGETPRDVQAGTWVARRKRAH